MEFCLIADTVTVATSQGLGFAKLLLRNHDFAFNSQISLSDSSSEQSSSSAGAGFLQISAVILPVDSVAPPPVRPNSYRTAPRTLLRKRRRTMRRSSSGGSEDGEDEGFFGDDGGDGAFGGGGGGGGGRGWNYDRFGGQNWDESSSSSSDPAFDFVYEVICWIALSNCVHFAFKKVVRIVAEGIGDAEREKVPMRWTPIC